MLTPRYPLHSRPMRRLTRRSRGSQVLWLEHVFLLGEKFHTERGVFGILLARRFLLTGNNSFLGTLTPCLASRLFQAILSAPLRSKRSAGCGVRRRVPESRDELGGRAEAVKLRILDPASEPNQAYFWTPEFGNDCWHDRDQLRAFGVILVSGIVLQKLN